MRTIFTLCGLIVVVGAVFAWRRCRCRHSTGHLSGRRKAEVADLIEQPEGFLG